MLKHKLEFCVPSSKINRECTLSEFKLLYIQLLKHKLTSTDALVAFNARLVDFAHTYCGSFINKSNFYLHCEHPNAVKSLQNNDNIIISKLDKGTGVVILNKQDYNNKIADILNNTTKFKLLGSVDDFDETTLEEQYIQSE